MWQTLGDDMKHSVWPTNYNKTRQREREKDRNRGIEREAHGDLTKFGAITTNHTNDMLIRTTLP